MLSYVNTEVLINLNINAHQFMIAIMLVNKAYDHLDKYLNETNSVDTFPNDLSNLAKKSLVAYNKENPHNLKSIVVQPEFLSTLHKDDIFEEMFSIFPTKVQRPDGAIAFLRRDKRLCKDLYYIITKDNRPKHEHIMTCLRAELEHRKKTNSMQYMKTLQKWLSGKEWENYEDLVADGSYINKRANDYGAQLM